MPYLIIAVVAAALFLLVRWHAGTHEYVCPECSERFSLSMLEDFVSPNGLTGKYVRCPRCGKRRWIRVMRKGS